MGFWLARSAEAARASAPLHVRPSQCLAFSVRCFCSFCSRSLWALTHDGARGQGRQLLHPLFPTVQASPQSENMRRSSLANLLFLALARDDATCCFAFLISSSRQSHHPSTFLSARRREKSSGRGFGGNNRAPAKTYGKTTVVDAIIDTEAAMTDFFSAREDWLPLFRCMAAADAATCAASQFLQDFLHLERLDDHHSSSTTPWQRLQAIPQHSEHDKQFLASFLDSMHQSLLDIPVTDSEGTAQDENDLQFLEEGRRMLAVNRFHVVSSSTDDRAVRYEHLFATCWNELMELRLLNQEHTGSLILFPGEAELSDLRRFADMNLLRPLEWLGNDDFEVAAMVRGEPAIRLIYRLQDMPEVPDDPSAYDNFDDDEAEE